MAKREFPNLKGDFRPKEKERAYQASGLSEKAFCVIKLILGILLLPFVYAAILSFLKEFSLVDPASQNYFWSGFVGFLLVYLIIWKPQAIYTRGHSLVEVIFSFVRPLVKVAPFLFAIYTIILFVIYLILQYVISGSWFLKSFLFLFGFSLALHLVFSADSIRAKKNDFLKANYIFGLAFILLINIVFISFCFNLVFKEFSFINFFNSTISISKDIFSSVLKQLFLG